MAVNLRWEVRSGVVPLGRASTCREADQWAAKFQAKGAVAVNVVDRQAPRPKDPREAEDLAAAMHARKRLRAAGAPAVNPSSGKKRANGSATLADALKAARTEAKEAARAEAAEFAAVRGAWTPSTRAAFQRSKDAEADVARLVASTKERAKVNPDAPLQAWISKFAAAAAAQRAKIAEHIGKVTTYSDGQKFILADVNDVGVLYWHKPGQKKLYAVGVPAYRVGDVARVLKTGKADGKKARKGKAAR